MNEAKNLLTADAADKLLACADGNAALLYLHIVRTGRFSLSAAARDLKRSQADITLAAGTLRRLGLLPKAEEPPQAADVPEYTGEDIVIRANGDSAFSGVVREAERLLGRVLNSNDLKTLLGIYDYLGLPADVIMLLLHHCIEAHQLRYGPGRKPTLRQIEKEGHYWAQQEILTFEAAEEHIRREKQRREAAEQVRELLDLRGQNLTPTQRSYIDDWLAMGFAPEALALAYDRTVVNTGKLAWKYMDSIVRDWDARGLHTPEEIEKGDPRRGGKSHEKSLPRQDNNEKMDRMRKMVDTMRGGKEG